MLISNSNPKGDIKDSGYYRAVGGSTPGSLELAKLFQKSHSTVIRNGNQLEELIYENCNLKFKDNKVKLSEKLLKNKNLFMVKCNISKQYTSNNKAIALDALYLTDDKIYVVEIKDGSNFDTKKSSGEVHKLKKAAEIISLNDPHKRKCELKIVLWNCDDLKDSSFKDKEATSWLMRGKDFSKLIEVDFDFLNQKRTLDKDENYLYVMSEFKRIYDMDKHLIEKK